MSVKVAQIKILGKGIKNYGYPGFEMIKVHGNVISLLICTRIKKFYVADLIE